MGFMSIEKKGTCPWCHSYTEHLTVCGEQMICPNCAFKITVNVFYPLVEEVLKEIRRNEQECQV